MIKYLRKYAKWVIPYKIYLNLKRKKNNASIPSEMKSLFLENKRFKNIHKGERCFVLASGPSIKNLDLKFLSGETCFAVSNFCLHNDIDYIKPEYQIIAPWHDPFTFLDLDKLFNNFKKVYNHNIHYFFGHVDYKYSVYNFLKKYPNNVPPSYTFINHNNSIPLDEYNYKDSDIWNITKNPFSIRTVIYSAIQIASYMGFKEIILLGCDHNYLHMLLENDGVIKDHHFYKEEEGAGEKEYSHLSAFTMERWYKEYYFRWKEFRLMQEYLLEKNIRIINATENSKLNVFPLVSLKNIQKNNF